MIDDNIKIKFGSAVITTLSDFARNGIPDPSKFDSNWFEHVQDAKVREALCDTLYGARWLYKIGLALLVDKRERYAHVRAQVIDYASICETLLAEMCIHGVNKAVFTQNQWKYPDFQHRKPLIKWASGTRKMVEKQTFAWYIKVCEEEKIITPALAKDIDKLRVIRNSVHITERAKANNTYSLNASDEAFKVMQQTINKTKSWYNKHP